MISLCIIIFSLILLCPLTFANTNVNLSDSLQEQKYLKTQYAGNIGLMSIGIGKTFLQRTVALDFSYGYLPKSINGVKVQTLALKSTFHFWQKSFSKVQTGICTGVCVTYNITSNTYAKYPNYYPNKYYGPNAFRFIPFIGSTFSVPVNTKLLNSIMLYSELGTIDYKLWYAIKNTTIKTDQIWNLCFGLAFGLKK
jgi:hypothetical protein